MSFRSEVVWKLLERYEVCFSRNRKRILVCRKFVSIDNPMNYRIVSLNRRGRGNFLTHLSENPSTKFQPSVQSNQSRKRINPFDRHPGQPAITPIREPCVHKQRGLYTVVHFFVTYPPAPLHPGYIEREGGDVHVTGCAENGRATLQARLKKKKYIHISSAVTDISR